MEVAWKTLTRLPIKRKFRSQTSTFVHVDTKEMKLPQSSSQHDKLRKFPLSWDSLPDTGVYIQPIGPFENNKAIVLSLYHSLITS